MADVVQKMMEEMIPELEQLQRAKLFSETEIKAIVKKRNNFEYQVQRQGADKQDFFRYLQYEMNLDLLRKARKKRFGIRKLPELSEFSGVRRIHYIFNRMLHRYGQDVRLWLQFIDFSIKSKSFKSLNKTFARALQMHPANSGLWIMTASWEFNHNQNMQAARALMSRAVRLNKHQQNVWHEFFRLELYYIQKIQERMSLFGMEGSALVPKEGTKSVDVADLPTSLTENDDQPKSESDVGKEVAKDLAASAKGDPANMDGSAKSHFSSISFEGQTKKEEDGSKNPFLEGAVPLLIYQSAIKEIPDNFKFREQFLNILQDFNGLETLKEAIYQSITKDFSNLEDCWNCLARRKLSALLAKLEARRKEKAKERMVIDKNRKEELEEMDLQEEELAEEEEKEAVAYAMQVYEEAVAKLSTVAMWKDYISFCERQLTGVSFASPSDRLATVKKIISICSRAVGSGVVDDEIYEKWIQALLSVGEVKKATDAAHKATKAIPSSAALWLLRIKLVVRQKALKGAVQSKDDDGEIGLDKEVNSLFSLALDGVPSEESMGVRAYLLELCMSSHVSFGTLLTHFRRTISVLPRGEGLERLKESVLTYVATSQGLENARKFYECAFDFPPTSLSFYHLCISMEKLYSTHVDYNRVRSLYHRALADYGETSTETWLDYIKLEADLKDFKAVQTIYWQAKNRLADSSAFIEKYNLIK